MSNIRMAKYETLIEDINSKIKKGGGIWTFINNINKIVGNTELALIYDYDKCNDYAKVIMDKARLKISSSTDSTTDLWAANYSTYGEFKDVKRKINASKNLVQWCRKTINITEGYKFIFWALMILTVDKTDAEEHLAIICDFAKMLRITEDEFEDIIQVIKIIYNEVTNEYVFKSENIKNTLGPLVNLYDGDDIE